MKGLCILLMVIGHSGCPHALGEFIYFFHMPCFFVISGYLYKEKYCNDPALFFKKKLKTLYYPYLKYGLLFLMFHYLAYPYFYSARIEGSPQSHIFELLTFRGADQLLGGYWFLQSLFIAWMFFVTMLKFFKIKEVKTIIVCCITFIGAAFLLSFFNIKMPVLNSCNLLATAYLFFGYYASKVGIERYINKFASLLVFTFLAVLSFKFTQVTNMMLIAGTSILWFFPLSILGCYFAFCLCKHMPVWPSKILCYLGEHTIIILTFHFVSFKIITLIVILATDTSIIHLQDFPTIISNGRALWLLYVLAGVSFPLALVLLKNKMMSQLGRFYGKLQ